MGVPQTELTKPARPAQGRQEGRPGRCSPSRSSSASARRRSSRLNQVTIEKYQRLLRVTDDDDPQKADFHFRIAELYDEQQRYNNFQARSLDQKIFEAKAGEQGAPASSSRSATRRRSAAGCSRRSSPTWRPRSSASTSDGRGPLPAGLPPADHQEGGPGARVLPPPDQGLPELEVRPRRLPVVRPVLLRQGRDGRGQEVLREGRAVPQVARSTATPSTRRVGATSTWATSRPPWRPSSTSSSWPRRARPAATSWPTRRSSARPRRTWSRPTPARPAPAPTRPGSSSAAWAATSPPR